ncbi:MAG: ABC transporter permease [Betaproteobacteria bacterium]|nr:ABC transporter permease [Betaproteobacteria bacterium]
MINIALFECRTRLSRISTWVYFLAFFALSILWIAAAGGLFKDANISFGSGKVFVNSPYALAQTISVLGTLGLVVMATVMGRAVQQDYEYRAYHFFFTSPISKFDYLGGRFIGALAVVAGIFSSIGLGAWLATMLPGMDPDRLGPNHLLAYLWPYLQVLLPNALLIGSLFFATAALTRKMLPVYIGSILFLIGYLISLQLLRDVDNKTIASLIDPFGTTAMARIVDYWTVAERNTRLVPFEGVVLWNRLLWMGISLLAVAATFWRFSFSGFAAERLSEKSKTVSGASGSEDEEHAESDSMVAPAAIVSTNGSGRLLGKLVWLNFRETVKNIYFGVIVFAGLLFLIFASTTLGSRYGTNTWPVTYQMTDLLGGSFGLFMLIIITFYAGELMWRERDNRLDQILDATPAPTWLPLLSKLLALMLVPVVLQTMLIATGVLIQAFKGYTHFELGLYVKQLLVLQLGSYWLICALAIAVHSVINNKYLGHFAMILYYIVITFASALGFDHNLYQYAEGPRVVYSDMNGFGHFLWRAGVFQAYWTAAAGLMLVAAYLMWTRGTVAGWRERMVVARDRFRGGIPVATLVLLLAFVGLGGYVFYNTNVLNQYVTSNARQQQQVEYEKQYKATAKTPQPRIVAVKVNTELYPAEQRVRMAGTYRLKNKNDVPVTDVWLGFLQGERLTYHQLDFGSPAQLLDNNEKLGVRHYRLTTPLAPGAETTLTFDLEQATHGFANSGSNTQVVYNGSFINGRAILPSIGYQENAELARDQDRKKFGLAPKERMRDRDDAEGLKSNYLSNDADWIDFETTVGTEEDQIAIAPGYLQKEWKEGGRHYFHYKMDVPILNFFAYLSARYAVKTDVWKPDGDKAGQEVPITIYYQPGHEYNLERMFASVKASLSYYSKNFGPYQHKQFRIIEFPRYDSFAQAFPNTIPYSESIGFIARVREDDEKDIDYPYYVTAHEAAHQWWAHQVMGGNVQGGTMLSETMAQYSALMVMKQKYGEAKMKKFLTYELERYLLGRAFEQKSELPLGRVENQPYIHYAKGSLVMYALQDYIGEDKVNAALKAFRDETAYQGPPYPNATQLIKHFRAVTPPHLQYLIDDMFESITLYDNRATKATYKELAGGKFEVMLKVITKKLKADKLGKESDAPIADWIEVGVLDEKGVPLFLEKRKFDKEESEIVMVVDKKPAKAGVDPLNKLIDRRPRDNVISVEKP